MDEWKNYDLYIFDFDGTICDTQVGMVRALSSTLSRYGFSPSQKELGIFLGFPIEMNLRDRLGIKDEEKINQIVREYREFYFDQGCKDESVLYSGIVGILESLYGSGKKLAIASLKPKKSLDYLVKVHSIEKYFSAVCGPHIEGIPIKKEEVLDLVFQQLPKTRSLLIGDSISDVTGAHRKNIPCIAVYYGHGAPDSLSGASAYASTVEDLAKMIL